ncbi:MAG: hypothetical protein Q9213_000828 [Squamulea squamosa]
MNTRNLLTFLALTAYLVNASSVQNGRRRNTGASYPSIMTTSATIATIRGTTTTEIPPPSSITATTAVTATSTQAIEITQSTAATLVSSLSVWETIKEQCPILKGPGNDGSLENPDTPNWCKSLCRLECSEEHRAGRGPGFHGPVIVPGSLGGGSPLPDLGTPYPLYSPVFPLNLNPPSIFRFPQKVYPSTYSTTKSKTTFMMNPKAHLTLLALFAHLISASPFHHQQRAEAHYMYTSSSSIVTTLTSTSTISGTTITETIQPATTSETIDPATVTATASITSTDTGTPKASTLPYEDLPRPQFFPFTVDPDSVSDSLVMTATADGPATVTTTQRAVTVTVMSERKTRPLDKCPDGTHQLNDYRTLCQLDPPE